MTQDINVGIVGFGWMGQVHAKAMTRVLQHYPDLDVTPRLVAVADTADDGRLDYARNVFGVPFTTADWRELVARDDVDLVCVAGPNFTHRDVAVAAARAGKHVWVEKPAGRNLAETEEIAAAIDEAGVASAVGFNYRNAPAVELARDLIASGRLGEVRHVRVQMFGDYCAHPDGALTWRFVRELAGSGVIGDLASHGIDLVEYVVGPIDRLLAETSTFITERPQAAAGAASHFSRGSDGPRLPVENEDHVLALLRFASGAPGTLEASRASVGRAERLQPRDPRQHRRALLGLPADGRAAPVPRPGLPGGVVVDPHRRPGRRRVRRLPARHRDPAELRRPQGDRGQAPARLHLLGQVRGRHHRRHGPHRTAGRRRPALRGRPDAG